MNTKFNFNLTNSWWVALSHGHSAFLLLKQVSEIEDAYDSNKTLMSSLEFGQSEYLAASMKCSFLTKDMLKASSASIALFQSMMEAIINNAIESSEKLNEVKILLNDKRKPFEFKWKKSLENLGKSTINFDKYNESIYKKYRIPLIHPNDNKLAVLNEIEFKNIRNGYRYGWDAYEELYCGLGKQLDLDSWKTMCGVYNIRHEG